MRILYVFQFDVTKKIKRENAIEFIQNYMKSNELKYQDICFQLHEYKEKDATRKKYFEKLAEKDSFWKKYYSEYEVDFAKSSLNVILSNLNQGNWERLDIEDDLDVLLKKIDEQMSDMPKQDGFEIVFNEINWNTKNSNSTKFPLQDLWTPTIYPLSSNITIRSLNLGTVYITFIFEMDYSMVDSCKKYVFDFQEYISVKPEKDVRFVLNDEEKELHSANYLESEKILEEIDCNIVIPDVSDEKPTTLHIKKILNKKLAEAGFEFYSLENRVYEYRKVDRYNNLMDLFFDYDRKCLGATLSYRGAAYKKSLLFNDVTNLICDEQIELYTDAVIEKCKEFEEKCVEKLVNLYGTTPAWFEWD